MLTRACSPMCCAALLLAAGVSLKAQPSGADLEDRAASLFAAGKYSEAAGLYESLAAREPRSASVFINLGVAYAKMEKFALAAAAYRSALKIDPASMPALINLGLAEFKAGRYADAVRPLETALGHDPDNRQVQTLLAMSRFSLRQFASASPLFESLFEAEPRNTMVQYLLGECYFRSHQQNRLDAYVEQLSKISPDSAALHMLAGEAYDRLNRTEEAIQAFEAAKRAAPDLPRIHFYLGYLHWERREYEEAAAEFEAERASATGEVALSEAYLGDIAVRNRDLKRAELLLTSAVQRDDRIQIARLNLGIVYAEQGRVADAQREFEAAVALAPDRVDAYYRLAQVYRAQGKLELQRAMLRKIREMGSVTRQSAESVFRDSRTDSK